MKKFQKSLIDYKSKMIEKYSTKTVNNYIIIINKFIKYIELNENDDYSKKKLKNTFQIIASKQ